ncbi:MAG TPA: hypothetical protein VG621_03205 [Candidatus Paceibacterota bacterium]|nr:hypothetical protein [Candidatus Paceibacterota bacterium]
MKKSNVTLDERTYKIEFTNLHSDTIFGAFKQKSLIELKNEPFGRLETKVVAMGHMDPDEEDYMPDGWHITLKIKRQNSEEPQHEKFLLFKGIYNQENGGAKLMIDLSEELFW